MRLIKPSTLLTTLLSLTTLTHADDWCITQGTGNCQGIFSCASETAGDSSACGFFIHDYACNQIGELQAPSNGNAIDSKQPYTVDIVKQDASYVQSSVSVEFAYAGGIYGKGATSTYSGDCSDGLVACSFMRVAFECQYP